MASMQPRERQFVPILSLNAVLGTCATFSATAPPARTKTGGARRGGAKVKNNGAVARE